MTIGTIDDLSHDGSCGLVWFSLVFTTRTDFMKTMFTFCAIAVCGFAFGGEPTSVLNHGNATPAPTVAPQTTTTTGPTLIALPRKSRCANGQCQLYTVDEQSHEYVRHRLFGGQVVRKGSRTVLRPVR